MVIFRKNHALIAGVILCTLGGLAILLYLLHASNEQPTTSAKGYYGFDISLQDGTIVPIPQSLDLDEKKVSLGEKLFLDVRLSHDNSLSCESCHNLNTGATIPLVKAVGMNGQVGERNSPTLFNSVFNIAQFWDGRAKTLEDQIDGPIENTKEMGSDWENVLRKLKADTSYVTSFSDIYPDGITADSVKNALATFERSLITPNSRFDRYLRGEESVLNAEEIRGYQMFRSFGCSSCHQGVNIGSNLYQKFGVFVDADKHIDTSGKVDTGRFAITGAEKDKFVFKVPTLRNIALTAPYFHDGSAATLEDAVKTMGKLQLGRHLDEDEIKLIISFLKTLTGEYKGKPL